MRQIRISSLGHTRHHVVPGQPGHAPGPSVETHRAAGPGHGGAAWPGPGVLSEQSVRVRGVAM